MPTSAEIAKNAVDDFKKIQKYMILAKEEHAVRTYAELKDEYLALMLKASIWRILIR